VSDKRRTIVEAGVSLLALGAVAGSIVYGALEKLATGEKTAAGSWDGNSFATLGWVGLILLVATTVRAVRSDDKGPTRLLATGIGAQLLFAAGVAGVSLAWAAERQNYWEAYHFAVLVWNAILGAVCGLVCIVMAARRGSVVGQFLIGLSTFWVLCSIAVWTWTWSSTVQVLEADITRGFYLATHE
jgi:hypothetical protein